LLGEPLAALLSGAGIELPGQFDEDGEPLRATWQHVLHSGQARQALASRLISALGDMDPDELGDMVDDLIVGSVEVNEGGAWVALATGDMVDAYLPDVWGLVSLVKEAFGATVLPISADAATSDASSAAAT